MRYPIANAYDWNPARLQILVKRNRKSGRKASVYTATLFSTVILGMALVANLVLI